MSNPQKNESGQAIVLIALAMVALIAFAGLAIDGGMVYADRRHAQNASDAGSLSGGGATALTLENQFIDYKNFACDSASVLLAMSNAEAAAIAQMEDNGYIDIDFSVETFCSESANNFNNYIDVTTHITKETDLTLIQIVYDGPLINRVDATTRVTPRHPYAFGNAIVALHPETDCDNASAGGLKFGGTGEVDISGGGAWSDGCLVGKGNCNVQMDFAEGVEGIAYVGGNFGLCPIMSPEPVQSEDPLPPGTYELDPPDCYDDPSKTELVDSIAIHGNQDVNLNNDYPGVTLICLQDTGNALKMTGGTLTSEGITIYLENGGDVQITGGDVTMIGPPDDEDTPPGIPGVIIYAYSDDDPTNNPDSNISIEGNHHSEYTGLIYGPTANIKITGEGDLGPTLNTQIIGWDVTVLGTAQINIIFNDSWVANFPTSLDLEE